MPPLLEICPCPVESSPGEFLYQILQVEEVCSVRKSVVDKIKIRQVGGFFVGVLIRCAISCSYLFSEVLMDMQLGPFYFFLIDC